MSEKVTIIGSTNLVSDIYVNFFPQYKVEGDKLVEINQEDLLKYFYGYHQINIGAKDGKQYDKDLMKYSKEICIITFSEEDIFHYKKDGEDRYRLLFANLKSNDGIKIASEKDSEIYKVTTTEYIIDWKPKFDEPFTIRVEEELVSGNKYAVICTDSKCRGLFEYRKKGFIDGWSDTGLFVGKDATINVYDVYEIYISDTISVNIVYVPKGGTVTPPDSEINRKKLCDAIHDHRSYNRNDIYNILICITQGFLTVFAGEPGTGKTSICDTMAKIIGLREKSINRYLSISVERGWTSKNDLIGYYNPLTKSFTDNTGLYGALKTLDAEGENSDKPYWVLLDEANLSQMEHYWSSFIKLADADARKDTQLTLAPADEDAKEGITTSVAIPDTMKFLATINNDHTTESLSPRLLDRAWVISLPRPTGNEFQKLEVKPLQEECIKWEELNEWFGAAGQDENDKYKDAKADVEAIYEVFEGSKIIISPRSKMAIEDYLKAAVNCFEGDNIVQDAVDFVILQKLLPMLNRYISDDFKKDLKNALEGYGKSSAKFGEMLEQGGNNANTYVSFFM